MCTVRIKSLAKRWDICFTGADEQNSKEAVLLFELKRRSSLFGGASKKKFWHKEEELLL